MQVLDSTIATVALPYMQGSMSASRDQITWVLTSYVIVTAIMTAPVGWIAARFGRKNVYIASLIGFVVASALCGAAQTLEEIVIFRVLQGAVGAALVPLSQSMMYDMYPPERRSAALALFGTGVMVGPILGPTIGGYLTDALNWRWVFYVNVPVGIAAAIGLLFFPSKGLRNTALRFDWTGFLLLALGLGSIQLMLDRGTSQDWFHSSEIIIESILAFLGFYLFAVHLATADSPFVPRALLKDRSFIAGFIGFIMLGQILNASLAALPPYLQGLGGYSVLQTGLVMSPRGIGTVIAMQIVGQLATRGVDTRYLLIFGSVISMFSLWSMASWTPDVNLFTLIVFATLQGFGVGLLFIPLNISAFATIPLALRTDGTAIMNLARNLGGAMGVAISSALVASSTQRAHEQIAAHVNPFNRPLQLGGPGFMWNPALPTGAEALEGLVHRQAEIIAYSNNFIYLGALSIVGLVLVFIVRRPAQAVPKSEGHAMD